MQDSQSDPSRELVLDGNSAAGLLREVFGREMTLDQAQCASCGAISRLGEMLVFGGAMGSVLRCPQCNGKVMRIVTKPEAFLIEMQGISYLRQERVAP